MEVTLIQMTQCPKEMLIFSKKTRQLTGASAYDDILLMPEAQKDKEVEYVFNTIGSSWEFVDFIFLIAGVTRAFTHQLVRHRVGVAYAQQAQRVVDLSEEFDYLATGDCENDQEYHMIMQTIKAGYASLMRKGVRPQDARGVLPTNVLTNILFKANLRTLSHILSHRLCFRAQGEFQEVARELRQKAIKAAPWAAKVLDVYCLQHSSCLWHAFEECPVKQTIPELRGLSPERKELARAAWELTVGYDPQPKPHTVS